MVPSANAIAVLSDVPGRLRFRFVDAPDNATRALVVATLQNMPGITTALASPTTGSVLVHYEPRLVDVAQILSAVEPVRRSTRIMNPVLRRTERPSYLALVSP
jgi:hypothetical protein